MNLNDVAAQLLNQTPTITSISPEASVEHTAAEEELRRRNQELSVLNAANLAVTQSLDLDTVLKTLLDCLRQVVPYDSATVMLIEPGLQVTVQTARGYDRRETLGPAKQLTFDARANPVFAELFEQQQGILIADTHVHPTWDRQAGAEHMHSWMGVPLIAHNTVIGLYSLSKEQIGFFTLEHLRMAQALATQAVVAIQNARMYEELRASRAQLQTMSQRLMAVREAERRHIACELHDEVGQLLTGLRFVLAMIPRGAPEQLPERVAEAQSITNDLITRVQALSLDLRPTMLDDLGLLPALLWHFERYTAQTQIQVAFSTMGLQDRFAPEVETAAYRVIQEALTNVARYAGTDNVGVWIWVEQDVLGIQIEDQGCGFDPDVVLARRASTGLTGMRDRAQLLGGELLLESAPGAGTRVLLTVPLKQAAGRGERDLWPTAKVADWSAENGAWRAAVPELKEHWA